MQWTLVRAVGTGAMLKKTIKSALNNYGYSIVQNNRKYEDLIGSYESLLKQWVLKDLPSHDSTRNDLISQCFGVDVKEAFYLIDCLERTKVISGDVCEFGIAQGSTSALIAHEIRNSEKQLWLFDSFEGLPAPTKKDKLIDDFLNLGSIDLYKGTLSCPEKMVQSRLEKSAFPPHRTRIVKGFIEDTMHLDDLPNKVSFAFVDFDFYEPIKLVLDLLHDRMDKGGMVMVDDYGYFSEGVQIAVSEFLNDYSGCYELILPDSSVSTESFCILKRLQ